MSSDVTNRPLFDLLLAGREEPEARPTPIEHLSDEELLVRIEARDRTAAAMLFRRYSELVFGIGMRILRDRTEAEEFVQDIFVGLLEKVRGFDPAKGSGRTWIVQIAYRRAFDRRAFLARRKAFVGTELDGDTNSLDKAIAGEQYGDVLAAEQLYAALASLNEKQRATLELHFFEGLTLREVGERLGESLDNTRHFYYRGLEGLRRILKSSSSK